MAHSPELTAERPDTAQSSLKLKDQGLLRHQCLIGGEWVSADGGGTVAVKNPASGEKLGTAQLGHQSRCERLGVHALLGRQSLLKASRGLAAQAQGP